jgi:BA14K-like protein
MTNKTAVCAIAASVLVVTASLSLPVFAQSGSASSGHTKKMYSTSAAYRAGLRHGIALRSAYDRGYIDGTRMVVSRSSVYTVNPNIPSSGYSTDYQYSSGYRAADYDQPTGRASPYEGLYASTQIPDGDVAAGYAAPQATPQYSAEAYRNCVARYRSFDPASGTFLAYDGNRYFCR